MGIVIYSAFVLYIKAFFYYTMIHLYFYCEQLFDQEDFPNTDIWRPNQVTWVITVSHRQFLNIKELNVLNFCFSKNFNCIYLNGKLMRRERSYACWFTSQMTRMAEARSQVLHLDLPQE